MTRRRRLDDELVEQGFFSNRQDAMRAVMAGEVSTQDRRLERAGEQVEPGIVLHVRGHIPFVSRGGLKLERGLQAFDADPTGLACLDVGCSTGAASVLSVDVGYAQFDWSLRSDSRVTLLERTNIVDVPTPERAGSIQLAVCDVSFTSVTTVLPAVLSLLSADGAFLTLVKPQFEAPRDQVGEGGVVRDSAVRLHALERIAAAFADAGLGPAGCCESPVRGHKGNVEYLLYGRCGLAPAALDLKAVVSGGAVALA